MAIVGIIMRNVIPNMGISYLIAFRRYHVLCKWKVYGLLPKAQMMVSIFYQYNIFR